MKNAILERQKNDLEMKNGDLERENDVLKRTFDFEMNVNNSDDLEREKGDLKRRILDSEMERSWSSFNG